MCAKKLSRRYSEAAKLVCFLIFIMTSISDNSALAKENKAQEILQEVQSSMQQIDSVSAEWFCYARVEHEYTPVLSLQSISDDGKIIGNAHISMKRPLMAHIETSTSNSPSKTTNTICDGRYVWRINDKDIAISKEKIGDDARNFPGAPIGDCLRGFPGTAINVLNYPIRFLGKIKKNNTVFRVVEIYQQAPFLSKQLYINENNIIEKEITYREVSGHTYRQLTELHNIKTNKTIPDTLFSVKSTLLKPNSNCADSNEQNLPEVGTKFPNAHLTLVDGREVSLSELVKNKQVTIVTFWFLSCSSCRSELNHLSKWSYKDHDLNVIAINSVEGVQYSETIARYFKTLSPGIVPALDTEKISDSIGIKSYPSSFILSRDGTILWRGEGFTEDKFEQIKKIYSIHMDGK